MSDAPQAPETDTPEPGPAVADTPAAPQSDPYESRYNDLRSEFDRRNGLIAAAQNGDPDALSELGFELYQEGQQDEPAPGEGGPGERGEGEVAAHGGRARGRRGVRRRLQECLALTSRPLGVT